MAELTDNINLFQPTGFKLIIDRKNYPNLEFFAQTVSHPGATLGAAEVPFSRIQSLPQPGDTLSFSELSVTILLDEDFNSYTEMYNWMVRLIQNKQKSAFEASQKEGALATYTDITVVALTSHNNLNKKIRYVDAIPVSVGDINFEATNSGVEYITFPVNFRFSYFEIE
jgi:hypothetical protein